MKKIIAKLLVVLGALFVCIAPQQVFASGSSSMDFDININKNCEKSWTPDCDAYEEDKKKTIDSAESLVRTIIGWASLVVGLASVGFIIWGGIMYSAALGDPGKIQKAKMIIIAAVVGLIIALLSGFIVSVVLNTFGL